MGIIQSLVENVTLPQQGNTTWEHCTEKTLSLEDILLIRLSQTTGDLDQQ